MLMEEMAPAGGVGGGVVVAANVQMPVIVVAVNGPNAIVELSPSLGRLVAYAHLPRGSGILHHLQGLVAHQELRHLGVLGQK